jgi:hypothetical protein
MVFNQTQSIVVKNNLIDELRLNPVVDTIPSVVNPTIQPVFEVKKKFTNLVRHLNKTTTGASTILTTSSTQDTYITALVLCHTQDATCDGVLVQILATTEGSQRALMSLRFQTTTANGGLNQSVSFPFPVKLDRNTAVQLSLAFTAGTCASSVCFYGYTEETAIKTV